MLPRRKRERLGREDGVFHSEPHKKFVRGFICAVRNDECLGKMHAHHTTRRSQGGGDETCVPLCAKHHDEVHVTGVDTFAAKYRVNLSGEAAKIAKASSHYLKWKRAKS